MRSILGLQQEIKSLHFELDWFLIRDFDRMLAPVEKLTRQIQLEQYTAGDFMRDYTVCVGKIREMQEDFTICHRKPEELLAAFKNREKLFMENINFLSALYMDARFNNRISSRRYFTPECKAACIVSVFLLICASWTNQKL